MYVADVSQYQQLADKYAPTAPEIADTLAHLQLPTDLHKPPIPSSFVPLPKRGQPGCNQHQIALLIRDGRRAAQQLGGHSDSGDGDVDGASDGAGDGADGGADADGGNSGSSAKDTLSGTAITANSTVMEQDFTVEGKKGVLDCPFSAIKRQQQLQRQKEQLEQENMQLHIGGGMSSRDGDGDDDHDGADTADAVAAAGGTEADGQDRAGGPVIVIDEAAPEVHKDSLAAHAADDPICVTMLEESASQHAPSSRGAARCPIRFLDQHSPEEVARYVETHKHELPRSHEICLKRYNKNEEQIRKIDAKYGNLVNMISGLGQFHQPMLTSAEAGGPEPPEAAMADRSALYRDSHERVKTWANGVSASGAGGKDPERAADQNNEGDASSDHGSNHGSDHGSRKSRRESIGSGANAELSASDLERESHFNRPLKEVRLGESPSRPWGIPVPVMALPDEAAQPPLSPPAAPVRMPSPMRSSPTSPPPPPHPLPSESQPMRRCPFAHNALAMGMSPPPGHGELGPAPSYDDDDDEFMADKRMPMPMPPMASPSLAPEPDKAPLLQPTAAQAPPPPLKPFAVGGGPPQPAFIHLPQTAATGGSAGGAAVPQMVFTGPVFIGYPMEQALQFMRQFPGFQHGSGM